jgi:hypothetical protein
MILDTATGCLSSVDWLGDEGRTQLDVTQVSREGKLIDEACGKIAVVGN